jgi:hypothetical protein
MPLYSVVSRVLLAMLCSWYSASPERMAAEQPGSSNLLHPSRLADAPGVGTAKHNPKEMSVGCLYVCIYACKFHTRFILFQPTLEAGILRRTQCNQPGRFTGAKTCACTRIYSPSGATDARSIRRQGAQATDAVEACGRHPASPAPEYSLTNPAVVM